MRCLDLKCPLDLCASERDPHFPLRMLAFCRDFMWSAAWYSINHNSWILSINCCREVWWPSHSLNLGPHTHCMTVETVIKWDGDEDSPVFYGCIQLSIHPSSSPYPEQSHGVSCQSRDAQTSSPQTPPFPALLGEYEAFPGQLRDMVLSWVQRVLGLFLAR